MEIGLGTKDLGTDVRVEVVLVVSVVTSPKEPLGGSSYSKQTSVRDL